MKTKQIIVIILLTLSWAGTANALHIVEKTVAQIARINVSCPIVSPYGIYPKNRERDWWLPWAGLAGKCKVTIYRMNRLWGRPPEEQVVCEEMVGLFQQIEHRHRQGTWEVECEVTGTSMP